MSSWYQPQEKAQWWFEKGVQSTTMITGAVSEVCDYDLTTPNPTTNTYYVSTTYDYDSGSWSTSLSPPPQATLTGLMGSDTMVAGDANGDLNGNDLEKIKKDVSVLTPLSPRYTHATVELDRLTMTSFSIARKSWSSSIR